MKVVLRTWGGFTGKAGEEVRSVDLDLLSSSERGEIERLVGAAGFFSLPPKLAKSAPRPWDFQHALTVTDTGREHTVTFHEDAAPAALRELVKRLAEREADTE